MGKPLIAIAVLTLLSAAPASAIDLDDVIGMLEADVSEEVILRVIDSEGARFYLTAEDILDLTYAGASDWFLEEMLDRSRTPRRTNYDRYYVHDPYRTYVSIGLVYDPFDYYFVTWPYYYAYVSPFHFSWTWWYYGGHYHWHWWGPTCWRMRYYDHAWGSRSIWDRGYRDRRYHVPRYDLAEKEVRRAVYDRSSPGRISKARYDATPTRDRHSRLVGDRKVRRSEIRERPARTERPARKTDTWGRTERPRRSEARPAKPSRPEVRTPRPSRGSSPAQPSKPQVRPQRPSRSSPSTPARPSRPSGGSKTPSRPSRGR
jgi:hypothetical protein